MYMGIYNDGNIYGVCWCIYDSENNLHLSTFNKFTKRRHLGSASVNVVRQRYFVTDKLPFIRL